ncbi:hypothetical protein [Methanocrinis sp.]
MTITACPDGCDHSSIKAASPGYGLCDPGREIPGGANRDRFPLAGD